ncbi:MAG: alpha/beta fold hydrolase [Methylomonas sp.]
MPPVELAYEHYGEQHSGCPLIILHGFFGSSRNWRAIAQRLAADYPVYVLDMRNHGLSPHAPEMDYPSMAEDLAFFMERLNLSRAHILGHSMGGKIAMWFALQQPERVENLLIADISPVSYAHSFENLIQALKNLPLHELGNRKQADIWLEPYISESPYRQFLLQNLAFQDGNYYWRVNLDYFLDNAGFIAAFPELENIQPYPKPVLFLA